MTIKNMKKKSIFNLTLAAIIALGSATAQAQDGEKMVNNK